jgi:hypothetical protein
MAALRSVPVAMLGTEVLFAIQLFGRLVSTMLNAGGGRLGIQVGRRRQGGVAHVRRVSDRIAGVAMWLIEGALPGLLGSVSVGHDPRRCKRRASRRSDGANQTRLNCSNGCRQLAQW